MLVCVVPSSHLVVCRCVVMIRRPPTSSRTHPLFPDTPLFRAAGPLAMARLLAWLPAGGVLLGTVLGADPVAVLLGGGVGGLCLVGGGALFLIGHRWEIGRAHV